jgi:hypothetical protein
MAGTTSRKEPDPERKKQFQLTAEAIKHLYHSANVPGEQIALDTAYNQVMRASKLYQETFNDPSSNHAAQ